MIIKEETPEQVYRRQVATSLRRVLEACSKVQKTARNDVSGITSYHEESLSDCLEAIDWKGLCQNHADKQQNYLGNTSEPVVMHSSGSQALAPSSAKQSALEEILLCLSNPFTWPDCCTLIVIKKLFVQVFALQKQHNRRCRQRSRSLNNCKLVQFITEQASRIPAIQSALADLVLSVIDDSSFCIPTLRSALSLTTLWSCTFPSQQIKLQKCLLKILNRVDASEIQQNRGGKQRKEAPRATDDAKTEPIEGPKYDSRFSFCLARQQKFLHGELSDTEEAKLEERGIRRQHQFERQQRLQKPTKREIFATAEQLTEDGSLGGIERQSARHSWTEKLRWKCITSFLSSDKTTKMENDRLSIDAAARHPVQMIVSKLHQLVDHDVPSPSIRLCAMLLGTSIPKSSMIADVDVLQYLVQLLWNKAVASCSQYCCVHLRWFAEIIIELPYFDNIERLWKAILPLIQELKLFCRQKLLVGHNSCPSVDSTKRDKANTMKPYLRCFACIVGKRGNMLQQLSRRLDFSSITGQLALGFGSASDWVDIDMLPQERYLVIQTLQMLSIVGVCDQEEEDYGNGAIEFNAQRQQPWPFGNVEGVRAVKFSNVVADPKDIFSLYSPSNQIPPSVTPAVGVLVDRKELAHFASGGRANSCDYLNVDLLHHLFSFFDYKVRMNMRRVCKTWKIVADDEPAWRRLYEVRYGKILPDDPEFCTVRPEGSVPWRVYFATRWHATREVTTITNLSLTNTKARLCPYVGCLHIIRSNNEMRVHLGTHKRVKNPLMKRKLTLCEEEDKVTRQQCKVAESKKQRGGTETCIQVPARGIGPVNEPNANDVLCGRVHSNSRHPGNIQFRKLTHARKKEYLDKSTTRLERTRIATDVVHFIRMERGGRFLKEDPDGGWFDIGDAEAIKKVRRALL